MELNSTNFKESIKEGVSAVDFWAPWCGPCRAIAPVIEDLEDEYSKNGKAKIFKINTDEEQDITMSYGIRSIPTIVFFKDGEVVDQIIGPQSKEAIQSKIESLL